jgi:hypothetical protein
MFGLSNRAIVVRPALLALTGLVLATAGCVRETNHAPEPAPELAPVQQAAAPIEQQRAAVPDPATQPTATPQTPDIPARPIFPLTGLPAEHEVESRPIMVMVENSPAARPQSGLDQADIVYEILAEGDITRFAAVYQSRSPEKIGPVRSIRPYYVEIGDGLDAYIVHAGWSQEAMNLIASRGLDHFDEVYGDGKYYWRDSGRKMPHNLYTSIERIRKGIADKGFRTEWNGPKPTFALASGETVATGQMSSAVEGVEAFASIPVAPTVAGEFSTGLGKMFTRSGESSNESGVSSGANGTTPSGLGVSSSAAGIPSTSGVMTNASGVSSNGLDVPLTAAGTASTNLGIASTTSVIPPTGSDISTTTSGTASADSDKSSTASDMPSTGLSGFQNAQPASKVTIPYSRGYKVSYTYDPSSGTYMRAMNGQPHKDALYGIQLSAANLIVCEADHRVVDSVGRREVDLLGSGRGVLVQQGKRLDVTWENRDGLIRVYADGQELGWLPGSTWVQVVPTGTSLVYD